MFHCAVLTLLVIALFPGSRDAYPNGPPVSACQSMFPEHGVSAQNSSPPVTFNMTQGQSFKTGDYIPVTLRTTDGKGFGGFFIQARLVNNKTKIAGMIYSEGLPANMKTLDCLGTATSAVSHSSKEEKTSVTVFWHAANVQENVIFRATVVREKAVFWVNVDSTPFNYSTTTSNFSPSKPQYPTTASNAFFVQPVTTTTASNVSVVQPVTTTTASNASVIQPTTTTNPNGSSTRMSGTSLLLALFVVVFPVLFK